jgi:capsular polysaccharide biosynthesis protein
VGGSRRDRTVTLCATSPNQNSALAIAGVVGRAMTTDRGKFLGKRIAQRTFVTEISDPSVARVSSSKQLLNFAVRLFLGLCVALGLALLWDALDPRVRDDRDVEQALGVPVLARASR